MAISPTFGVIYNYICSALGEFDLAFVTVEISYILAKIKQKK